VDLMRERCAFMPCKQVCCLGMDKNLTQSRLVSLVFLAGVKDPKIWGAKAITSLF